MPLKLWNKTSNFLSSRTTGVFRSQNFNYFVFIPNLELLRYNCDNVLCTYYLSYSTAALVLAKCYFILSNCVYA
jgi:hypothetical protein